jgi:hypothetical protein
VRDCEVADRWKSNNFSNIQLSGRVVRGLLLSQAFDGLLGRRRRQHG